MARFLDVYDFGAVGDGIADDTKALQYCIDEAANTGKSIVLYPGKYLCGELFMRPAVHIKADATWGFGSKENGSTVILQRDDKQACVIDMTEAHGSTLDGLVVVGNRTGNCCGILSRKTTYGEKEDAYRIENCRVSGFSSHAVFLDHIWCFSVRHSMFCFSGGDGLAINGWDGFIIDNWFSGNNGAGFGTIGANASVTMTGNRIEWNKGGGIRIDGGSHYNITGNYIDRSGTAAIAIRSSNTITCTGNILYRSGKFEPDVPDSAQCILEGDKGVVFSGNSMCVGRDDGGKGVMSPNYGMRIKDLSYCSIIGNTMYRGGLTGVIDDRGGHTETAIDANVGISNSEV